MTPTPTRINQPDTTPKFKREAPEVIGNRCNKCKLEDVTDCPLREAGHRMHGWIGLKECAMGDAIDKMILAIKLDNRFLNSREMKEK